MPVCVGIRNYESGMPMFYPGGCRWTKFVEDWEKVVSRFNGRVNINGFPLESPEEETAYMALELDKVYKYGSSGKCRDEDMLT